MFQIVFHTENINKIVEGAPVYLAGEADIDSAVFRIQGNEIIDKRFEMPPFLPRESVYYIVRNNHHLMYYRKREEPNTFYIAKKEYLEDRDVIRLYQFTDFMGYGDFVLYRLKT